MTEEKTKSSWDYLMLLVCLCLSGMGLVMVFSASGAMAAAKYGDAYYFIRPQLLYTILGLAVMILTKNIPFQYFCKLAYPLLFITAICLALVLTPGIGHSAGGASRWLRFFGLSFQPSELAKMTLVIYLAYSLASKKDRIKDFAYGFFPHMVVMGVLVMLVVNEPDLGAAVILAVITLIMLFVAGVRLSYLFSLVLVAVPIVYFLIVRYPYRLKRILAYLSPWDDPLGAGYHIIHSFMAFAAGGLTGAGPGNGQQKLFFLPEPHTDFIFSVVGEEFGFIGAALVMFLFLILVWRGLSIASKARDLQGGYLALGLTLIIGLQAFMNMAVAVGLIPTKGLILPFFSYGGSALLVNFACMGVIMNIASQSRPVLKAQGRIVHG